MGTFPVEKQTRPDNPLILWKAEPDKKINPPMPHWTRRAYFSKISENANWRKHPENPNYLLPS